jgi:PucR C-terminal helix-turn-helix domain
MQSAVGIQTGRTLGASVGTATTRHVITDVLPEIETVIAALAAGPGDSQDELRARVRLAYLSTDVAADADDLEAAIGVLRARAAGDQTVNPFGRRIGADSYDGLVEVADRAVAEGDLDLMTVLALQYESGAIAAVQGHRLLLFRGVNAQIHRLMWEYGAAELARRGDGPERLIELGRWLMLWTQASSLAVSEGYRDTERETLARDVAARRAALDELIGSVPADTRARSRLRRLATSYGLDASATYRVAAILPGPEVDPTPDEAGIDDDDLDDLARRIDQLLSRRGASDRPYSGIRAPVAFSWRGSIVAILGPDPREWARLQESTRRVLSPTGRGRRHAGLTSVDSIWTAIAMQADGVPALARSMVELQEGLRVAKRIGRRGVIDDVAELSVERLLLSDPDLAAAVVDRELGPLLTDQRMGDELVETLQVYYDVGGNRRETARRLHLADRTVAYRLKRAEDLLGHGFGGEPGRRLNVALTLKRLEGQQRVGPD